MIAVKVFFIVMFSVVFLFFPSLKLREGPGVSYLEAKKGRQEAQDRKAVQKIE